ncbi:S8 family peptidase [Gaopeijia maritima]|uniref:S8 family peptidase n=1 Tax=Gaopeijia maritima TaxID=3119007 RepID=UPI0032868217
MKPAERAAVDPPCHGLLMKVGGAAMPASDRLAIAARIVRERLPGRWSLDLLGPGATVVEIRRAGSARRIRLSTAWNHCARLRAAPEVAFAEPSLTTVGHDPDPRQVAHLFAPFEHALAPEARLTGDDPLPCAEHNRHWSLQLCRVPEAWALEPAPGGRSRGAGIVVGHPDTGYTEHPEIWDTPHPRIRAADGWDFADDDAEARDPLAGGFLRQPGHGTATSSVIMSTVLADEVTGVAPEAELIPIRVTTSVVLLTFARLARAIHHAVDRGAHVVSISLGGPVRSRALDEATAWAASQGVIVLAAAGNIWPFVVFPARLPQVIGVGACNCADGVWKKSARGGGVDLSAPGEGVWRAGIEGSNTAPRFTTGMGYGTSFAVATCAGAAALWLAHHGRARLLERFGPEGLVHAFRTLLLESCRVPDDWDSTRDGVGILDARALLEAPLPPAPAPRAESAPTGDPSAWSPQSTAGDRTASTPSDAAGYLPDEPEAEVAAAALEFVEGDWAELGDELLFHLATHPAVRERLRARVAARRRVVVESTAGREPTGPSSRSRLDTSAGSRLHRQASTRLRALIAQRNHP